MDMPPGNFSPGLHPFIKCFDWNQAIETSFEVKVSPHKVIKDSNLVSFIRERHRLCPTEVSITAEYENAHCSSKNCDLLSPRRLYDITKKRHATGYFVLRCPGMYTGSMTFFLMLRLFFSRFGEYLRGSVARFVGLTDAYDDSQEHRSTGTILSVLHGCSHEAYYEVSQPILLSMPCNACDA